MHYTCTSTICIYLYKSAGRFNIRLESSLRPYLVLSVAFPPWESLDLIPSIICNELVKDRYSATSVGLTSLSTCTCIHTCTCMYMHSDRKACFLPKRFCNIALLNLQDDSESQRHEDCPPQHTLMETPPELLAS